MTNTDCTKLIAALKAALPHVERIAKTAPTEPAREKRQREAAAAVRLIHEALAEAA